MMLVPVSLGLLSLAGGMFLLAKTNKDNLGLFFKIGSYFIIISSFLIMACTGINTIMKFYGHAHGSDEMMRMHGKYEKKMYKKYLKERMNLNRREMGGDCCCGGYCSKEDGCSEEGHSCGMGMDKKADKCEMKDSCRKMTR